jgi:tRNA-dihydrouridine synthase B
MNVERGAQIIDINMGCPAKKVCKKAAGSALLQDEPLVGEILDTVVNAVDVPVTLKIRTGWNTDNRNATRIAKMAEDAGIQALAVHGRTRACAFKGEAEYDTIAKVVDTVQIPVFANGDIDTPHKAKQVLDATGASAVMIGRAAQGRPWIFREIEHFLRTGESLAEPSLEEVRDILCNHLSELHRFYGDFMGPRIARKHVGWYLKTFADGEVFRKAFNQIEHSQEQHASVQAFFERLITKEDKAA